MDTITQGDKWSARIAFRVPSKFKRDVDVFAAKRGLTVQQLGIEAFARYLGVAVPMTAKPKTAQPAA
jgi:hypothetical protein